MSPSISPRTHPGRSLVIGVLLTLVIVPALAASTVASPTEHNETATTTPQIVTTHEERPTELTLEIKAVNRSAETARVVVELREADSDEPIALTDRPGEITIRNATLSPGADGTATATVPLGSGVLTARYKPGASHTNDPAYEPATATAEVSAEWPDPVAVLVAGTQVLLLLSPLLLGIYLIDGLLGRGRLWPPWRGLK